MAVRALMRVAQENLVCLVCYALLRSPVAFSCGHVFCGTCAERSIEERPRCPLCNHAVVSRRVITPLPTLATLMGLVHDVARLLRQRQTSHVATSAVAVIPSLQLAGAVNNKNNDDENITEESRSPTASASGQCRSDSITSYDDDKAAKTPTIYRSVNILETQLMHTPPSDKAIVTDGFVVCDDEETQFVLPTSLTVGSFSPQQQHCHQCVAVRRGGNSSTVGALERVGCCMFCALDVKNRVQVSHYLRHLLDTDPSCDRICLQQLSEVTLSEYLGPMWELHLTARVSKKEEKSGAGNQKRNRTERHFPLSTLLVHQACLEWCVLCDGVNEAATVALTLADTLMEQLNGSTSAAICSFCGKNSGRCLVPCRRCQRKAYHYPCALLTGAGVCVISTIIGSLTCAECIQEQREQGSRTTIADSDG